MQNKSRVFHCYAVIGGKFQIPIMSFSAEFHASAGSDEASIYVPMNFVLTGGGDKSKALDLLKETMTPDASGNPVLVPIHLYAGYTDKPGSPTGLALLFDGMVDGIQESYHEDTYNITARSFAYCLQQAKVTANFKNHTTVQVIQELIKPYNYTLKADPTTLMAGRAIGQDVIQEGRSFRVWDLITNFAQKEGREVWMTGTTLYYTNKNPDSLKPTGVFTWNDNLLSLEVHHQALFSHEVDVTVFNHSTISGKTIPAKAKKKGKAKTVASRFTGARAGNKERIRLDVYNMSQDQANAYAQRVYEEISSHELIVNIETEGDPAFTVHRNYEIRGASQMVNQVYHPKVVKHEFSHEEGYRCHMTLINHPIYTVGLDLGTSAGVQN